MYILDVEAKSVGIIMLRLLLLRGKTIVDQQNPTKMDTPYASL